MNMMLLFMAVVLAIMVWWFLRQRLTEKPWLEPGVNERLPTGGLVSQPSAKIGLGVFLAVATSLFTLFITAYMMRMKLVDWNPLPEPDLLWINTGLLVFSSLALHRARNAVRRRNLAGVRTGLLAAGVCAFGFMMGQLWAWQLLVDSGYLVSGNPANSFFYLITGLHGIHVLGGMYVWGRTSLKLERNLSSEHAEDLDRIGLSVELCSVYWHYLLLVWLVLFGVLLYT